MMKNYYKHIRLLVSAFIFITIIVLNCDSPADLDFSEHQSRLVANCFFHPDSTWEVSLTQSVSAFGNDSIDVINDAAVEIWQSGEKISTLTNTGDGIFSDMTSSPDPGVKYTLKVNSAGYEEITAKDFAPLSIPIQSVSHEMIIDSFQLNMNAHFNVHFTFTDNSAAFNYYLVSLFITTNDVNDFQALLSTTDEAIIQSAVDIFLEEPGSNYVNYTFLFSDKMFDGQNKSIQLETDFFLFPDENIEQIKLVLANISKDYYDYKRTKELILYRADDPFSEPVPIFSNIKNGLGIFAGYNSSSAIIRVNNP